MGSWTTSTSTHHMGVLELKKVCFHLKSSEYRYFPFSSHAEDTVHNMVCWGLEILFFIAKLSSPTSHSFEALYLLTPQMVITATVAAEKSREKRSCWLDTNSTAAKLYIFQAIAKHYGWYLGYRRRGLGEMIWQNEGQAAEPHSVLHWGVKEKALACSAVSLVLVK